MLTIKEIKKTAKENGFKFDVSFLGCKNGYRIYTVTTDSDTYVNITYNELFHLFTLYKFMAK